MLKNLKHKYNSKRCQRGELKFDSKLERSVWDLLETLRKSGQILFTLRQVPIEIASGKHYVDYLVFTKDEAFFIEVKGRDLDAGRVRRMTSEEKLNVQIHVVHKPEEILPILFPL